MSHRRKRESKRKAKSSQQTPATPPKKPASKEPWPKFHTVMKRTANGTNLIKPMVKGAIPTLVRPGMMTYEQITGNGGAAIITEIHPEHAVVKSEDGQLLTIGYHEMNITFCAPDPAHLQQLRVGTPLGFVGRKPDGELVKANYCIAGNEDIDVPIMGRNESEIHACAYAANSDSQVRAIPVYAAPQDAGMRIAGYTIRKPDGELLYVNCNDQSVLEVAATENGAHKTAIEDEVEDGYTIVPVFVGEQAVQS